MEWYVVLSAIFGGLIILMLTGLPIAFCFLAVNVVGAFFIFGREGLFTLVHNMYSSVSGFTLLAVPMFLLMGEVMFRSGTGTSMVEAVSVWLGRMPGRLGLVAVGAGTIFSATSGSTMATTALLGTVLTPEMEERGYKPPISTGAIVGSGGLAMMIPPSSLGVLLATLAKISVSKLLIGGIVPGLMMAFLYGSYVVLRSWLQPSIAPSYEVARTPLSQRLVLLGRDVLPLGLIIFLVIGLMLLGLATPSEASAMGVLGSVLLAAAYRKLNWQLVKDCVVGTLKVTVMIFTIVAGSTAFSQILAFSGASAGMLKTAGEFAASPVVLVVIMQVILLFLGCFMDNLSIMMITIPIYMPICQAMGWDPIWLGIIMLVSVETGCITPPFGLNLFVMEGVVPHISMTEIYKSAIPFAVMNVIVIAVLIVLPQVALWLPDTLR